MNELIQDVNPNANEIANLEAQLAQINLNDLDPMDNGKLRVESVQTPVVENKPQQIDTKPQVEEQQAQSQVQAQESNVDPILAELEREKGRTQGKTPQEKFAYKLKLEAQRAKEMGVNVEEILGVKPKEEPQNDYSEDKPLTRKDIEDILSKVNTKPQKTATELAYERIQNETERELFLLKLDRIKPSGDPEADFNEVKDMVDAIKIKNNMQVSGLRPEVKTHSTASSYQPIKSNQQGRKPTADEEYLIRDAKTRGIDLSDLLK